MSTSIPPFNTYVGVHVSRMEGGSADATLELGPHHLNNRGVVHGGVLTALLDTVLGAAVISSIPKEWWCATTSLSTQFLEGVGEGRLLATGRVLRRGKHVAFADGDVHDATGRLIATAQGSWHLWSFRPAGRPATEPYVELSGSGERIRVGKIVCVGRNYAEHVKEMGGKPADAPVFFFKPPSALVHDGATLALPSGLGAVHHEVELVVAIGQGGKAIAAEAALEHVLGYAVGLDLTLRDLQTEAKRKGEPWSLAKGFDGSAPVSAVTPREALGDGSGLAIALEVNGQTRQSGNTSMMLHGVPALLALVSQQITLERGDLVFTGTPSGVGPLVAGDRIEARIERVGTLTLTIGG